MNRGGAVRVDKVNSGTPGMFTFPSPFAWGLRADDQAALRLPTVWLIEPLALRVTLIGTKGLALSPAWTTEDSQFPPQGFPPPSANLLGRGCLSISPVHQVQIAIFYITCISNCKQKTKKKTPIFIVDILLLVIRSIQLVLVTDWGPAQ